MNRVSSKATWTCIVAKEFRSIGNRLPMLAGIYTFYFAVAWFALESALDMSVPFELFRIFLVAFLIQTGIVISFMLLPVMVYPESMTGMCQAYFAYGYSIRGLVAGKAMVMTILSIVPGMIFAISIFPGIFPLNGILIQTIFSVALTVFGIVLNTVFFSWFSRAGRASAALLIVVMVIGFSRIHDISGILEKVEYGDLMWTLAGIGFLLWLSFHIAAGFAHPERQLLRR